LEDVTADYLICNNQSVSIGRYQATLT